MLWKLFIFRINFCSTPVWISTMHFLFVGSCETITLYHMYANTLCHHAPLLNTGCLLMPWRKRNILSNHDYYGLYCRNEIVFCDHSSITWEQNITTHGHGFITCINISYIMASIAIWQFIIMGTKSYNIWGTIQEMSYFCRPHLYFDQWTSIISKLDTSVWTYVAKTLVPIAYSSLQLSFLIYSVNQ